MVPGLCFPWAFTRAAASGGATRAWGRRARTLAAGKRVPLCVTNKAGVRAKAPARGTAPCLLVSPTSLPCRSACQSLGSSLRSSSELLKLELELQPEPGLGPGLGLARQAKRRGLPGKIPFREFSRQWSGEGIVAVPGQMTTKGPPVCQPDDRQVDPPPKVTGTQSWFPSSPASGPRQALVDLNPFLSGNEWWREVKPEPGQVPSPSGKPAGELFRSLQALKALVVGSSQAPGLRSRGAPPPRTHSGPAVQEQKLRSGHRRPHSSLSPGGKESQKCHIYSRKSEPTITLAGPGRNSAVS